MDFSLSKEQRDIKRAAREFAEGEFTPERAMELDLNHEAPQWPISPPPHVHGQTSCPLSPSFNLTPQLYRTIFQFGETELEDIPIWKSLTGC